MDEKVKDSFQQHLDVCEYCMEPEYLCPSGIILLKNHISTLESKLEEAEKKVLQVIRREFKQICSYCGWASEVGQWEELQNHIKECPQHPLPKALKEIESLTTKLEKAEGENRGLRNSISTYQNSCKNWEEIAQSLTIENKRLNDVIEGYYKLNGDLSLARRKLEEGINDVLGESTISYVVEKRLKELIEKGK